MGRPEQRRGFKRSGITGGNWKPGDKVQLASIVFTFVVSVTSLALSSRTSEVASANEKQIAISRVETGEVTSNSNDPDYARPWQPWEYPVTSTTTWVGVQRTVLFQTPFQNKPNVITAISLIDLQPIGDVLTAIKATDISEGDAHRARQSHLVTRVEQETDRSFILQIGVGLPTEPAKRLVNYLETHEVETGLEASMRRYRKLSPEVPRLRADERWMANFYGLLGTIDVSWIALSMTIEYGTLVAIENGTPVGAEP